MKKQIIDISHTVDSNFVKWPGSVGYTSNWVMKMPLESNNLSAFMMDAHLGTHIDAPLHFVDNGRPIEAVDLNKCIGDVFVAEIYGVDSITAEHLSRIPIPEGCKKLILKTKNQEIWNSGTMVFQKNFASIDASGAQWLVDNAFVLIGIDYLSIQRFHDSIDTHQILLRNEVVILETLNLKEVNQGLYELYCLPLKIRGLEGVPSRAVLIKEA